MNIEEIKESGILELYVIGDLSQDENLIVEQYLKQYPSLKQSLEVIEAGLEHYAFESAIQADPTSGPLLFATVDYMERMKNGEAVNNPPALHPGSTIKEFSPWLDREDLSDPGDFDEMHGKIIAATEERTTLIIWLRHGAPDETHVDEFEKFLVVEGRCVITIGEEKHSLKAGDFLSIPLYISHRVNVTSSTPCKIILERAKAS